MSEQRGTATTANNAIETARETTMHTFTARYVQHGDWWLAYVEEVPSAFTQGKTLDEARAMLKDALSLMLDVHREDLEKELAAEFPGQTILREDLTIQRS